MQESPETLHKPASDTQQSRLLEASKQMLPTPNALVAPLSTIVANAVPESQPPALDTTQPIATQAEPPLTPAAVSIQVANPESTTATIVQTKTVTTEDVVGTTLILPTIAFLDTTIFTDGRNVQPAGPVTTIYRVSTDPAFPLALRSTSTGAVEFSSSNPAVATIAAGVLTIIGPGTAIISVDQGKKGNYDSGSQSVTIVVTSNACALVTCQNAGVCHVAPSTSGSYINDSFSCTCPTSYEGLLCEGTKTNCMPPQPTCENGGTCTATPSGGECACTVCYKGPTCGEYDSIACPLE